MAEKTALLYELVRTEDASKRVCGIGNSVEVSPAEAEKMVKAGTHKFADLPIGGKRTAAVIAEREPEPES